MADECDQAQAIQALDLKLAMRKHSAGNIVGASLEFCEECGEPIPAARRVAVPGVRFCIACQEEVDAD